MLDAGTRYRPCFEASRLRQEQSVALCATRGEQGRVPENWIAGTWASAIAGGRREIRCPADGSLVAEIDESTPEDTDAAIAAARAAFDSGPWPATTARER